MVFVLLLAVTLSSPFAQEVQDAYAHQKPDRLRSLLSEADARADSFLVRYRLYPLTEDASILDDLPSELPDGSARELALLSGLWSYRAGEASFFRKVQYGRRSANLLEQAKAKDAEDPYVLLVRGQSLLFRPAIAGRDVQKAAACFEQLATMADAVEGIPAIEAKVWQWFALKQDGDVDAAARLRDRLMNRDPAPLYRQFLEDPPEI
jgi:hypothetical protein